MEITVNKDEIIKALKFMDFSGDDIKKEMLYHIKNVTSIPQFITAYRILKIDDESEINKNEIGSHFGRDKEELLMNHTYCTGCGEKYFIVTAKIPKSEIDIQETIINNILYPHENEITVKNNGKNVKILNITEIDVDSYDFF
jgi:hypothetical protein